MLRHADRVDTLRRAATYVDRILRGANPAELPVQLPTKVEMLEPSNCDADLITAPRH
jgi:hypothetical protein